MREAGRGDDVVDQLGAAEKPTRWTRSSSIRPVAFWRSMSSATKKTFSGCDQLLSRQGSAPHGAARQAVREDRDVAAGLGGGDDPVVVGHHLRGVAAAAVQGDHQRVERPVVDARRQVGAEEAVGAAVAEALLDDLARGGVVHRRAGAEGLGVGLGGGCGEEDDCEARSESRCACGPPMSCMGCQVMRMRHIRPALRRRAAADIGRCGSFVVERAPVASLHRNISRSRDSSGSSGGLRDDDLQEDPGRQPRRDRHPGDARGERDGQAHGRGLRRGGQALAAPLQGRRGLPDRRGARAGGGLSVDPGDHPRREDVRRRRDPPGLRAAVSENPDFVDACDGGRDHLHRAEGRDDADARRQGERAQGGDRGRRAGDPGDRGAARRHGRGAADGRGRRLSVHAQGELGRRRPRDAADHGARGARGQGARGPARGAERLRQRRGLPREDDPERPPRRGADPRRQVRGDLPPLGARLLGAAPQPEGRGAGAGALPDARRSARSSARSG